MRAFLAALACIGAQELLDARCEVACKFSGYDTGKFYVDRCECSDFKSLEILDKKLNVPVSGLIFRND